MKISLLSIATQVLMAGTLATSCGDASKKDIKTTKEVG